MEIGTDVRGDEQGQKDEEQPEAVHSGLAIEEHRDWVYCHQGGEEERVHCWKVPLDQRIRQRDVRHAEQE
jgi:hypothetical protein